MSLANLPKVGDRIILYVAEPLAKTIGAPGLCWNPNHPQIKHYPLRISAKIISIETKSPTYFNVNLDLSAWPFVKRENYVIEFCDLNYIKNWIILPPNTKRSKLPCKFCLLENS